MNYEIVELSDLSGPKATIYSVILDGAPQTTLDYFLDQYLADYPYECKDLVTRLQTIAHKTGARESFFRQNEGKPGDGVCALSDSPNSSLRLFCIRYGDVAIIIGGGGPKTTQTWQGDPNLAKEAKLMIQVSEDIMRRINDKEIIWSNNGMQLKGDLNFYTDENE